MPRPFAVWLLLVAWLVPTQSGADALPLAALEPCGSPGGGPGSGYLCSFTSFPTFTSDHEMAFVERTITLETPADPENWQLVGLEVGFTGSATFQFVYPEPGATALVIAAAAFTDALGRTLLTTGLLLDGSCGEASSGPYAGQWVCSNGNSLVPRYASFGAYGEHSIPDPTLPSLADPIILHAAWTIATSAVPEFSELSISGASLGYAYVQVPEPSTALIFGAGLAALAACRRRRRR